MTELFTDEAKAMLANAVRQMLTEKGLPKEAVEWIIEDISPRLSFLDGNYPSDSFVAPPGVSSLFATSLRTAFHEIIGLEIELYRQTHARS